MKKNTSKHNIEIKNYEIIRDFIRKLFFMPAFNYNSMKETGYSKSKSAYHLALKRIKQYVGNAAVQKYQKENVEYNQIINDLYKYPSNFLLETYRFSSYSIHDLQYYFMIMQSIQEETTIDDLINNIKNNYQITELNYQSIRNKLNELVSLGYLKSEKKCGQIYYAKEDDILDANVNGDTIKDLDLMVLFFHNFYFLSVAGYDTLETIRQYRILNYNDDVGKGYRKENDIFLCRYNPIHHVLDNDIIWKILQAINQNKVISYNYINQTGRKIKCRLSPIKIITEYDYGRQYIFGYDKNSKQYFSNRIDAVNNLNIENEQACIPETTNIKNMWSVSTSTEIHNVKVYFNFPKDDIVQYKILKRDLYNTKRFGKITEKDDVFIFEVTVSDYNELVPWINSFGEYALVDKNICPKLYEKIAEHTKELMVMYGLI